MMQKRTARSARWLVALASPAILSAMVLAHSVAPTTTIDRVEADTHTTIPASTIDGWSENLWSAASRGDSELFRTLLTERPDGLSPDLVGAAESLLEHVRAREELRAEKLKETETELAELIEGEPSDVDVSDALVSAIGLQELLGDDASVLARKDVGELVRKAERRADAAESSGEWLIASELYYRLDKLYEDAGVSGLKYQDAVDRLNHRLSMVAMYTPERLWELRNQRGLLEGEDPLPPYNPAGNDFREKLRGVGPHIVLEALRSAASEHVEGVSTAELLLAGLQGVRAMLTTDDLAAAFPSMEERRSRERFIEGLDEEIRRLEGAGNGLGRAEIASVLSRVTSLNRQTLDLPAEAVLHEFGNGAMGSLDDFSAIIWPDELRQFEKSTQGNFIGVGIQIQLDEQRNIQVVTPIEGTPAHRAGIRSDDLIKSVDGVSTLGFTLNQAVDQITGPAGTTVVLGIEREITNDEGETETVTLDVPIERAMIEIQTVKGWERTGVREDDWDWFVDDEAGIGYVRLTQFTDATTRDFDRAIDNMRTQGLNALILDLRFNPGGLLSEAVSISDRFVPGGPIVSTRDRYGRQGESRRARATNTTLDSLPVVVLINEGSASASEIVSGAIRDHAARGRVEGVVMGTRSFGKGSVQNVWPLPGRTSAMKLTTQYYLLPGGEMIHRTPGATSWGVKPNLTVEMLPSQVADAIMLRRDADVLPMGPGGELLADPDDRPDPDRLLEDGLDLQLETALVLLRARLAGQRFATTSSQPSP